MKLFDNQKFRCSSLGKIMGDYKNSITDKQLDRIAELSIKTKLTDLQTEELKRLIDKKNAPKELPDTCTTYLKELYFQEVKGFRKKIASKYLEKGLYCEESGVTMLQKTIFHNYRGVLVKNTEHKENEFICGTCDVPILDIVADVKNCYDWLTFENAEETKDYILQLQGYGALWKAKELILFFCLNNLPEHMIQSEERKLFYSGTEYVSFEDPKYLLDCEKLREEYNFEKFPLQERFKAFRFEFNQSVIDGVYERIKECREWLNDFHGKQLDFYSGNLYLMGHDQN